MKRKLPLQVVFMGTTAGASHIMGCLKGLWVSSVTEMGDEKWKLKSKGINWSSVCEAHIPANNPVPLVQ